MTQQKSALFIITALSMQLFVCCSGSKNTTRSVPTEQTNASAQALAPVVVYKTTKDYAQYVPVIMNKDKTQIVSYPDPADLHYGKGLAYPTPLKRGYLLDNRGIGPDVVFLKYTYEVYSKLKEAPTKEQMLNNILDKQPLVEMWKCGVRTGSNESVEILNHLIDEGFPNCEQLFKEVRVYFKP